MSVTETRVRANPPRTLRLDTARSLKGMQLCVWKRLRSVQLHISVNVQLGALVVFGVAPTVNKSQLE